MRALLDISVLLALFDPGHTFHKSARAWWAKNESSGWATCPLTQNGLTRIMSQRAYPRRLTTAAIIGALAEGTADPSHEFWPDDVSIADPEVFDQSRILGPNQITDIYLLALAVKHGGRLVTFDRGIPLAAVRGAAAKHLVVLA